MVVASRVGNGPTNRATYAAPGCEIDLQHRFNELIRERRVSTARAAELMQLSEDAARRLLNQLVDQGTLEVRGERRNRTYHLSAAVYRALGEGAGYVRARGFDRLQQEQMILTFVSAHGRITRREAADLCQISSEQARGILKRLTDTGVLRLRGERRTAYYKLPDQTD